MSNITFPSPAAPILTKESTVKPEMFKIVSFAPFAFVAAAILTKLSTVKPLLSIISPPHAAEILTNESTVNAIFIRFLKIIN
ncbi:hypothetical protein [Flavobacterium pectinovorum]|uniref:Uncharacterized protein n=1 Tax=Flavobacterium pectinovorum TaxID=29533 RepID=A0A502E1V7_9FLAO|nr:hypothetical protein [Flavobacterium pectinovorum]TPG31314.1 hypothetical protein EAH81_26975 [Flavobacterium pectinovorum]